LDAAGARIDGIVLPSRAHGQRLLVPNRAVALDTKFDENGGLSLARKAILRELAQENRAKCSVKMLRVDFVRTQQRATLRLWSSRLAGILGNLDPAERSPIAIPWYVPYLLRPLFTP
jgi:hypothetical protein